MLLLLSNPTSGAGKGRSVTSQVIEELKARDLAFSDISGTSYESAALNLRSALQEKKPQSVIVVGGDGMVHLAIQELAETKVPLILVPAGTGNDFARTMNLDLESPVSALRYALNHPSTSVDLGRVKGKYFAEILSTGFDSMVNERANRMRIRSKIKYDLAMLLELPVFKPLEYEICIDGERLTTRAMLIAIANGISYGGGMKICPNSDIKDGLFDLIILEPVSKFEFLKVFPRVFKGTHVTHPKVKILQGREVSINSVAIAYADGERIGPLPITAEIVPGALQTWLRT
ncbi:MAG: YegS/Rv2252/BmrU family lipid kinase [Candidatus Nanopelagicaceae bacterium]|nr:YegS/Rv2252/BmrU family lipid kinase [Candidatus Nanopelagicaceae bacterium]